MTAGAPSADQERMRWRAFAVCVGVACLTILDLSKVNVGLPALETALGAGPTQLQLIVAGYTLIFGLTLVPGGRLGDLTSRRRLFVIGLSLFTVASLLCAIAPTIEVLIAARLLQGAAAGLQMPQVTGMIQQLFQGPERGRAFGLFGAIIGLSTAFGPALGGLLIAVGGEQDGWRLLFWMNVPLGVIALIAALRLLPRGQRSEDGPRGLDPLGLLLLGGAILALLAPFLLTTGGESDDPRRWFLLLLGAVLVVAFVLWERHYAATGRSPVLELALVRRPSFRNGVIVGTAFFAAMPALFLVATLYLQQGLALSALAAGSVSIGFALASALGSWLSGPRVDRLGRPLVIGGIVVLITGFGLTLLLVHLVPTGAVPWAMAAALTLAGIGGGCVVGPNQTLTLSEVPVAQGGVAGSVVQLGQRVGTAVGVAVATSTFYGVLSREAGTETDATAYLDAFSLALLVVIGLASLALVASLLDLRGRRHAAR